MCTFGCWSQVLTAVLAIVRMVSIYKPFLGYPNWVPLAYISVFGTLMFTNEVVYASLQFLEIDDSLVSVINGAVEFCLILNITHCILGIIASFLTMLNIALKRRMRDARVHSCYIICLMNVPYLFSAINYAFSKTLFAKYGYFFLAFVAVSSFTAMLNPILIVLLNAELRKFIKLLVCKKNKTNPASAVRLNKLADETCFLGQNTGNIDIPAATELTAPSKGV